MPRQRTPQTPCRDRTLTAILRWETRETAAAGLNAVVRETLRFEFFRTLASADRLLARRKARLARGDPTMSKLSRRRIANVR